MQWKVLSGLRFFLALVVILYHLKDYVPNYGTDFLCSLGKLNGLAAVFAFLLVSGYSIAHSICKKSEGFYQRRILRIYPLYVCGIILSLVPFIFTGSEIDVLGEKVTQPSFGVIAGNLVFWQNYLVQPIESNVPLWTLGVEAWCYLLAPIFVRLSNKIIFALISLSSVLYAAYPYAYYLIFGSTTPPVYAHLSYGLPLFMLIWAWLLGFLYFRIQSEPYSKFILVGLGFILLLFNNEHIGKIGIATYILSSLVLGYASSLQVPKSLHASFNYLGDLSYPMYIFHTPVLIFAYSVLNLESSFSMLFLVILVSMFFYHFVDMKLRVKQLSFLKA